MENDPLSGFTTDANGEENMYVASLTEKNFEHPRIRVELWKTAPLGYLGDFSGTSPVTGIDPDAFKAAGGTIAGYGLDDPNGELLVAGGSISSNGTDGADERTRLPAASVRRWGVSTNDGELVPAHNPAFLRFRWTG